MSNRSRKLIFHKVLFQSLLPNHGADQSTHQAGRNDDHQHGDGGDIQHPVYVLLGNVVLLHGSHKGALEELDGADGAEGENGAEQGVGHGHGLHGDFFPAHDQKIADHAADHQADGDKPESAHQQEQDSLDCGADGEHALFRYLSQ